MCRFGALTPSSPYGSRPIVLFRSCIYPLSSPSYGKLFGPSIMFFAELVFDLLNVIALCVLNHTNVSSYLKMCPLIACNSISYANVSSYRVHCVLFHCIVSSFSILNNMALTFQLVFYYNLALSTI